MPIASMLSPSAALSRTFATPPTSSTGSLLQSALKKNSVASPPVTSSFFTRAPALLPNARSVVAGWRPATPATVPPQPMAPAASTSVGGVFATIARLSQPTLPPAALQFARTQAPVSGLTATPVSAGWQPASFPSSPATPLVGYPPPPVPALPPALPPMSPAATTAPQVSPTSTLPDPGYYPQGGFDPGSSYDTSTPAPTPAPAASSPDFGTLALYGGGALVGLYLLSKMFKGGGGEASA